MLLSSWPFICKFLILTLNEKNSNFSLIYSICLFAFCRSPNWNRNKKWTPFVSTRFFYLILLHACSRAFNSFLLAAVTKNLQSWWFSYAPIKTATTCFCGGFPCCRVWGENYFVCLLNVRHMTTALQIHFWYSKTQRKRENACTQGITCEYNISIDIFFVLFFSSQCFACHLFNQ